MENIIEIRNLRKVYRMGEEKVVALNNVNLDIRMGEVIILLGPSGSGKSTLLNMMAGLEKPTGGTIMYKKFPIHQMNENRLAEFRRRHIGFVFQQYNLINTQTALDNITMPLIFRGVSKRERIRRGQEMLARVGLGDRLYHRPTEMSGGQQQRVAIARAFINQPELIFADEPTGNLDTKTSVEMMHMMKDMVREDNRTLIIVTHDVELSIYADRIVHIRDGDIEKILLNENIKETNYQDNYNNGGIKTNEKVSN